MVRSSQTPCKRLLVLGALALVMALGAPRVARADDKVTAQVLFETGRKLMKEGNYAEACPKLAESQRLDPGGGTLLNLAICHQEEGRTATAWGEFKEALGMARADGRNDRVKLATNRIAALEPKLSHLVVSVAPEAKVEGLLVTLDGAELGEPVWGVAAPVDPGERVIAARAPGHAPWETTLTIGAEADRQTATVPRLQRAGRLPPAAPTSATTTSPPTGSGPPEPTSGKDDGSTQRIIGFVIGGVGLASAVVGGVFGGLAISKEGEAEEGCDDTVCWDPDALDASDAANSRATLSNVFLGAGAGLVAAGLIIVLTAPDGPEETERPTTAITPWLGPREVGVTAAVAF